VNMTGLAPRSVNPAGNATPGYQLIRRLGQGGYADVWEAEAPGGFRVALKLVRPTVKTRSGELRAIEIIRGIRHPHLLVPFGAWEVEDQLVIAMELADRSLWDRYREVVGQGLRGIPRGELLGYLSSAAVAVDFLNGASHSIDGRPGVGIQHRDLKPQNILLFGRCAKVADFGMARVMERSTAGHTGSWTLPYAAPEFFHGRTATQSDQYSLAVTYCQVRGGRLPFWGTAAEIMLGHTSMPPDLERLPEPEREVVARALAKQPGDRWPDCQSFIGTIQAIASGPEGAVPDELPGEEEDHQGDSAGFESGVYAPSSVTIYGPSPVGRDVSSSFSSVGASGASDLFQSEFPSGPGGTRSVPAVAAPLSPSSVKTDRRSTAPPPVPAPAPEERPNGRSPWTPGRYAAAVLTAGLTLAVTLAPTATRSRSRPEAPTAVEPGTPPPPPIEVVPTVKVVPGSDLTPAAPEIRADPEHQLVPEPETKPETGIEPEPAPEPPTARLTSAERVTAIAAIEGLREKRDESLNLIRPLPTLERVPVVELPEAVSVRAGGRSTLPVRVSGGEAGGPWTLKFRDLPRGVVLNCPPVGPAAGTAEAVVTASGDAGPAEAVVEVAFASRPDETAARFRLQVVPVDPRAVYDRGRARLTKSDYTGAVGEFTEVLRVDPENIGARLSRGVARQLSGRYAEALDDYSETIRRDPKNADAHLFRGRVHQARGELVQAVADLAEAIRLQPRNANARLARAGVYHESGAYDKAMADYTETLHLRPKDASARYRRGLLRYHTGDLAGAVADFDAAIRIDPKHAKALRARSEAHARLGNLSKAAADADAFGLLNATGRPSRASGAAPPAAAPAPPPSAAPIPDPLPAPGPAKARRPPTRLGLR